MNKYTIGNFFRKNIITLIVCIIPVFIVAIIYFAYHLPDGYKPYIFNMSGTWKIQEGKNDEWIKPGFNDSGWKEIQFPGSYYNQGFRDRYSVVRKKFILNENMKDKDLFFIIGGTRGLMGNVYANGHKIGEIGLSING